MEWNGINQVIGKCAMISISGNVRQGRRNKGTGISNTLSDKEIPAVCSDLCNEINKLKADFKTFQSNITVINCLRDLVNVLNKNLSKLSLILTELENAFPSISY